MKYYNKDPKKNGVEISSWDFLEESGMVKRFREKGLIINPTHDFNKLKEVRLEILTELHKKFIEERILNKLETSSKDESMFKIIWLNEELKSVEGWLSDTFPNGKQKRKLNSYSNRIEIEKYKLFVMEEISILEKATKEKEEDPLKKIKENETALELFLHYKGNVDLFQKVKIAFKENYDWSKHSYIDGVNLDNVQNLVSMEFINKHIFNLLEAVHMFSSQPIKCTTYVKSFLKSCPLNMFNFIKPVLIESFNDNRRFDRKINDLQYLIKEIEILDYNNLQSVETINEPMLSFFLGKDSIDLDVYIKANLSVRGMLMTEAEKVKEYINKNRQEILSQLRGEYNNVLSSSNGFESFSMVEVTKTIEFKNNFDKVAPIEVYNHFKAGLVDKGFLTEKELDEYLKLAFELKIVPETLFTIKDAPTKTTIEAVFYKYYKNVAGKIHGKKNLYAALLGDYFKGYKTSTVSSNFNKSVY